MTQEELDKIEKKALEQFTTGKSLFGKDGAFAPLLKNFLDKALEAEMKVQLGYDERSKGNKRNGKGKKTLRTGVHYTAYSGTWPSVRKIDCLNWDIQE